MGEVGDQLQLGALVGLGELVALQLGGEATLGRQRQPLAGMVGGRLLDPGGDLLRVLQARDRRHTSPWACLIPAGSLELLLCLDHREKDVVGMPEPYGTIRDRQGQECIRGAKAAGRTVLLSSHLLAQVEVLADRVSIIRLGRIVESGSLAELRHLSRTTVSAEVDRPAARLARLPGVHNLTVEDGQLQFEVDAEHLDGAVRELAGYGVRSLVAHPPTLEQLLLRYYADAAGPVGDGAAQVSR